jgi:HlyD family secretion protein
MSKSLWSTFILCGLTATAVLGDDLPTEVAKRKAGTGKVEASGVLQPEDVVDVGARVPGRVQRLGTDPQNRGKTVDFGTRVEAGTVLLQLDPTLYQSRMDKARAQLDKARAALKAAKTQSAAGNVRKVEIEMLEADVELAQARLKEAEARLGYTTIRSPVPGVIIDRRVNIGQNVGTSPKLPGLFLIGKVDHLQLWAQVKEADISKVRAGQTARVTIDAFPGRHFKGVVAAGKPRLNTTRINNKAAYTVVVNLDNPDGLLIPYLTAHVELPGH